MIKLIIKNIPVLMTKFFSTESVTSVVEAMTNAQKVLFVDTPSTEHLANCITELQAKCVECIVRDHHNVLDPQNPREEAIKEAAELVRNLADDAIISTRDENPACSLLMSAGEFTGVDAIVADPDPDGLLGVMKALGITYPELDSDAVILDGPRSEQTPERLSNFAMLLVKGMATLPPYNPKRPEIAEKAKGDLFSQFVAAAQGDAEAQCSLEQKVEEYEAGVAVAKELVSKSFEVFPGLIFVDTTGSERHDLVTLTRGLEAKGAKVTCIKKNVGPIASVHGSQFSLAVVKRFQKEINLQNSLPADFVSSPASGIISNTTFLLHVSENIWNDILPAIQDTLD